MDRVRNGIVSRIEKAHRLPKRPMIAGVLSGLLSGITLGAFTGPVGMVLGFLIGTGVGLVAGYMLAEELETHTQRHKELDDIIGITRGSMGAGPIVRKATADDEDDAPAYSSKEQWLAEWLTPPPPNVLR